MTRKIIHGLSIALLSVFFSQSVYADESADAETAINAWTAAVISGDATRVDAILAPEFQIMRGNGKHYTKESYLAEGLPKIARNEAPGIEDITATGNGELLVVTYWLVLDVETDGQKLTKRAPRMTVFRKDGTEWKVTAHANFALPVK